MTGSPADGGPLAEAERYVRMAVANRLHSIPPDFLALMVAEYDRRGGEIERLLTEQRSEMAAVHDIITAARLNLAELGRQRAAVLRLAEALEFDACAMGRPGSFAALKIREACGVEP